MEKKNVLFFLVQRPICSKNETGDLLKDKAFYIRHIIQTATALLWQPQSRKSQSIPQQLVQAGRAQAGCVPGSQQQTKVLLPCDVILTWKIHLGPFFVEIKKFDCAAPIYFLKNQSKLIISYFLTPMSKSHASVLSQGTRFLALNYKTRCLLQKK